MVESVEMEEEIGRVIVDQLVAGRENLSRSNPSRE